MAENKEQNLGERAFELISERINAFIADHDEAKEEAARLAAKLPPRVLDMLEAVLTHKRASYRDAVMIQLGYTLGSTDPIDATLRQEGGRTCAMRVGQLLKENHIKGVPDAYQNVGKNSTNLARGNVPAFDGFLHWVNIASRDEQDAALSFVTARVALTSRPVRPMPKLDRSALTFAAVARVLNELLDTPSGGAHEQFAVAAFLHTLIDEFGMGGVGGLRAETKPINASDASAGTAADVQIKRGNRTEEAFEVTANAWGTKIAGAAATVRTADLQRVHVLASVPGGAIEDVTDLLTQPVDISVLDARAFLHGLTAMMRKPARAAALTRFYELMERLQPDIDRVNAYVGLLERHGLVAQE